MTINHQLSTIQSGGGELKLNGQLADVIGVYGALGGNNLNEADLMMIEQQLKNVIDQMSWNLLPNQARPGNLAPTLNFQISGPGKGCTIGAKWDRTGTGKW